MVAEYGLYTMHNIAKKKGARGISAKKKATCA
jgi:hypothetical protein